ncbi:MAG: HigA family addiction module antitoxin, partial [Ferruginibacter sp.]
FLDEMKISAYKLSKDLKIQQTRISQIILRKTRISADTALRLSLYFNTSAKFWIGLQDDYDIEEAMNKNKDSIQSINQYVKLAV